MASNFLIVSFILTAILPIFSFLISKKNLLGIYAACISCFIVVVIFYIYRDNTESYVFGNFPSFSGIEFKFSYIQNLSIIIICAISIFSIIIAPNIYRKPKIILLLMLNIFGVVGLISTNDLFNAYVFIEISSICFYALLSVGTNKEVTKAALDSLIMGTVAATFFLLSVFLLYNASGSLNIKVISENIMMQNKIVIFAYIFLLFAILIKLGLASAHQWILHNYIHGNQLVNILSIASTSLGWIILYYKIFANIFSKLELGLLADALLALNSIILGVLALKTKDMYKIIAYSTMSTASIVVIFINSGMPEWIIFALLINDAITKVLLFSLFSSGLIDKKFWIYPSILLILNVIGIPPLFGFFIKFESVILAINARSYIGIIALVFSSAISVIYFFNALMVKDANNN